MAKGCFYTDRDWSYHDHEPQILQEFRDANEGLQLRPNAIITQNNIITYGRLAFKVVGERYGLASTRSQVGDLFYILHGSDVPVILRRSPNNTYQFIGQCYFENCMHGEAVIWDEESAEKCVLV